MKRAPARRVGARRNRPPAAKRTARSHPPLDPDEALRRSLEEAEEIGLLLDDEHDLEEQDAPGEEEAYFVKAPGQSRHKSHARPAQSITVGREVGGGRRDGAAGLPPKSAAEEPAGLKHLFPRNLKLTYPIAVRAEGVFIHDSAGRKYLDGCGGAVVCSIGHGVKEVADVMTAQARRLAFTHSSQFLTRETIGLADRVAALAPGDMKKTGRVYLVSGGSEAVETAIKLARQYHVETGHPGKSKIIARWQSYHGSTMGALSVTGNLARRNLYTPLFAPMPHIPPCYCYRCPYGLKFPSCGIACVEDLEAMIHQEGSESVAAFIAEPVVGATLGAVPAVDGYWKRAREICTRHNVLLIADEVMTGIGRTGKNFAVDHFKVVPDLIVTGKGLSGGYAPLGAVIARGFIADALRDGRGFFEHGFTYSANPLSAAVGSAVLDYVARHKLVARAARMGAILGTKLAALKRHRIIGDVRGMGMMWGLEIVRDRKSREPFPPALKVSRRLYEACVEEGLLIYPGSGTREGQDGDHFIIAPPFTITREELDDLVARLDRGLARLAGSLR
ncbi:MAG TPA: aspartate aminotransferase family protein [Candidatus Polarisedimenticolia bacterium]